MEVRAGVRKAWRGHRQGANKERRDGGRVYPNKNRREGGDQRRELLSLYHKIRAQ